MRCDDAGLQDQGPGPWFQSLSGFLMRCDRKRRADALRLPGGFNPYRVF